jgi:hypothetical protein
MYSLSVKEREPGRVPSRGHSITILKKNVQHHAQQAQKEEK